MIVADWLELHHINVIGGDATLIVVRNLDASNKVTTKFRALIDSGAEGNGTGMLMSYLTNTIGIDPKKPDRPSWNGDANKCSFDLIITTHLHTDHIRGFSAMGLIPAWYIDTTAEVAGATPSYPDIGRTKGNGRHADTYALFMANAVASGLTRRISLPFTNRDASEATMAVDLMAAMTSVPALPLKMNVVCANGILAGLPGRNGAGATTRSDLFALDVNNPARSLIMTPGSSNFSYLNKCSPNDFSIGTFVEWGDFSYFTSGDLSGDSSGNDAGHPTYKDLERFVIGGLEAAGWIRSAPAPGIDVVKIAHHGSSHSTYAVEGGGSFLGTVRPRAMVVPTNQKKQVPGTSYLRRAADYVTTARTAPGITQATTPGMLLANNATFWSGETDYTQMERIMPVSTQVLGGTPVGGGVSIPLNLTAEEVEFANDFTVDALHNAPNESVVVMAGVTPEITASLPLSEFGDTSHTFSNFSIRVRTKGSGFDNAITLKNTQLKTVTLTLGYFEINRAINVDLLDEICRKVWDKALFKNLQDYDEDNVNIGEAGYTYIRNNLPALYGDYVETESEGAAAFAARAAPNCVVYIASCYNEQARGAGFGYTRNDAYKSNNPLNIQTVSTLVQSYLVEYSTLTMPPEGVRYDAVLGKRRAELDAAAAATGGAVKKSRFGRHIRPPSSGGG